MPLVPASGGTLPGWGVYLRTDFWAPIETGGSYGHTCYVAKELAEVTDHFVCVMANRFALLDELGVHQVVLTAHSHEGNEEALLSASPAFNIQLRPLLETVRPGYIYERLCVGNLSGAQLSWELGIPYIIEYNGSENSMRQSFGGGPYDRAELFDLIEDAAFSQATVVSVVSRAIADSLVKRGVDRTKIVVNPNAADPDDYRPALPTERDEVRAELGFEPDSTVIGFIGTFGGWHGVDVMAKSIPEVLDRAPGAVFLLIGDGPGRPDLTEAVLASGAADRVVMTGRVPHKEGARLLRACDIFVSPHASHMVDSPFFGSPTKLFEYMAMGKAVVASNLEQIGEVLSPSFSPHDLLNEGLTVDRERAVLCTPGDAPELVEAICSLVARPDVALRLGDNARQALVDNFTWERHVKRLLGFISSPRDERPAPIPEVQRGENAGPPGGPSTDRPLDYKTEITRQWDIDPCGSHYVASQKEHTLEWFEEASRYRYQEYAPWMPKTMEFSRWTGKHVLEVGGGIGTDLVQFARNGAETTDCDMSTGHLALARENFSLRGLPGSFVRADAEALPVPSGSFDLAYSNGVVHHTPGTRRAISEMHRALRPGGRAIVMVYAEPLVALLAHACRGCGAKTRNAG